MLLCFYVESVSIHLRWRWCLLLAAATLSIRPPCPPTRAKSVPKIPVQPPIYNSFTNAEEKKPHFLEGMESQFGLREGGKGLTTPPWVRQNKKTDPWGQIYRSPRGPSSAACPWGATLPPSPQPCQHCQVSIARSAPGQHAYSGDSGVITASPFVPTPNPALPAASCPVGAQV